MVSTNSFGVFIPLIIIGLVILLGIVKIGVSEEVNTIISVPYAKVFPDAVTSNRCDNEFRDHPDNEILLQTIKIKNKFLMPRLWPIPRYTICFTPGIEGYSERTVLYYVDGILFERAQGGMFAYDGYSFRLPTFSEVTLEVKIKPFCEVKSSYSYGSTIKTFVEPSNNETQIMLIKPQDPFERYPGISCRSLGHEEINNAITILLTK